MRLLSSAALFSSSLAAVLLTVFALPPVVRAQSTNAVYTRVYSFDGTHGSSPADSLIQATDGNFYGVTYSGGSANLGTLFRLTPGGALTTLLSFDGSNGMHPYSSLLQGQDGGLYGSTIGDSSTVDGTAFRATTAGALTTIHTFPANPASSTSAGYAPVTPFVQLTDGTLYGVTPGYFEGLGDPGTIFKLSTTGAYTLVHTFVNNSLSNGIDPNGPLLFASDGNLYGTTQRGSTDNSTIGTIFRLTLNGGFTVLYRFTTSSATGAFPFAGLIEASDGNFYGTTGGEYASTLFRVTKTGVTTTLYNFTANSSSPFHPSARLLQASDGFLYGTSGSGGAFNAGGAFRYDLATGACTTLYDSFTDAGTGHPYGALIESTDGDFYGVTSAGGTSNQGTIYKLTLPPVVPASSPIQIATGEFFTYQIIGTRHPTGYAADGLPPGLSVHPVTGLISGTPTAAGSYTVTIRVTNVAGTTSGTLTIIIGLAPPPVIGSPGTATGQATLPFSYQITASGHPTGYTATGLPVGLFLNSSTGLISGTPTVDGSFTITITVTNSGGTTTFTLIIVIDAAVPPVVSSPGTATAQTTLPFSYQIIASGHPTGYAATGLPAGLILDLNTGLISGVPTATGTFNIVITVTNAFGTTTFTLIIIIELPPAPVITSPATATGQATLPFTYQIIATGHPTGYAATGLPVGLSLDPVTGLLLGTPTLSGTFSIVITVTNAGGSTTFTLVITIGVVPAPTLTILSPVPQITANGGVIGIFLLVLPHSLDFDLIVHYTVKGTAIAGADYAPLKGTAKIKAGKTSKQIKVIPTGSLGGASKKTVKIVLTPGDGYLLDTTTSAKVKILAPGQ